MGPRRTNLALLVVLVAALASGGLAFAAGTGWGRPVLVAHGLAGLAVLVLAPWKSVVVRRGLARRSGPGRWASVAFGALVLVAVAAGLAHATGRLARLGPLSAMQVHVGAALAAVPLLAWHVAARGGTRAGGPTCPGGPCCGPGRWPAGPGCCSWPSRARPGWPGWRAPGAVSPARSRWPPSAWPTLGGSR